MHKSHITAMKTQRRFYKERQKQSRQQVSGAKANASAGYVDTSNQRANVKGVVTQLKETDNER